MDRASRDRGALALLVRLELKGNFSSHLTRDKSALLSNPALLKELKLN
jgi:hypothetical protein